MISIRVGRSLLLQLYDRIDRAIKKEAVCLLRGIATGCYLKVIIACLRGKVKVARSIGDIAGRHLAVTPVYELHTCIGKGLLAAVLHPALYDVAIIIAGIAIGTTTARSWCIEQ